MEANSNQSNVSGTSEHGSTGTKVTEKKRKRTEPLDSDEEDIQQLHNIEDNFNFAEQLRNVQEKLASLNGEVETVKTENRVLSEKNNTLVAKMGEMEQKLKVVELEMKLAKQEINSLVTEKLTEATGKLREELEHYKLMNNERMVKLEEKQSKSIEEIQQNFNNHVELVKSELANTDMKIENLEKLAKQLDQGMTELRGKMDSLQNQPKTIWGSNRWHNNFILGDFIYDIYGQEENVRISADGLVVTTTFMNTKFVNVRAEQPISRAILTTFPGLQLVYYELFVNNLNLNRIGWVHSDSPLIEGNCIGYIPGSYVIDSDGSYFEAGQLPNPSEYGDEYKSGDVVGSGMLLTKDDQLKLFFTKNGQLNAVLSTKYSSHDLLFPAVYFYS